MPNTLMTADQAAKAITDDWTRIVNANRRRKLSKSDAVALFGFAYGKLDMTPAEVAELMADDVEAGDRNAD